MLWKYASYLEENTNAKVWFNQVFLCSARNSYQSCSIKKAALKNSAIFTGKDLCWNLFLIKLQAFGCFLWKLRNVYAAFLHWTKSKPLFRSICNSFFTTYSDVQGLPFPVDAGRKLNVHKTFRRRPGRLLNVLCTFNLRSVYMGELIMDIDLLQMIIAFILELQLYFFGLPIIKNENVKYHKC